MKDHHVLDSDRNFLHFWFETVMIAVEIKMLSLHSCMYTEDTLYLGFISLRTVRDTSNILKTLL